MNWPCGPPECTTSWCGTAWAQKLPLRKARNCVCSCGARRWSSCMRGHCSSPAPPSCWSCDDGCGARGQNVPQVAPWAWSASGEHTGVDDDGGDRVCEYDTKVKPESLMLPGPGCVYTQSKDSIPPEVHDGPPCHAGGSWGACWCDACGSHHHLRHWSTGSCACGRTFWVAQMVMVVSLHWMKDGLNWAEGGRSAWANSDRGLPCFSCAA